jgi:tellurite resistance protein TerC
MVVVWVGFILLIILLVLTDLGLFNRRAQAISLSKAMIWSAGWVAISLCFTAVIYDGYAHHHFGIGSTPDAVDGLINDGPAAASKYLTGYVLEKALSVDNLFVIAVIFRFLAVPPHQQHRVLFWGIFGAMLLRGVMIGVGVELILHYHWVLYIFGAFLLFTGTRLLFISEKPPDPAHNLVMRIARRILPFTNEYHDGRFSIVKNGSRMLTPLALALILIETSDVVFATDSIPAVFAVTADPLLVFTSNIFAVLGLRTLYFALAGLLEKFHYLKVSLALILIIVGGKIFAAHWLKLALGEYPTLYLLATIAVLLIAGVVASVLSPKWKERDISVPTRGF